MKKVYVLLTIILLAIIINSCTAITHEYGPFYGKVVDSETGEPIAGAAVLLRFTTETILSPGGPSHLFRDAIETTTDENGTFRIEKFRLFSFRFLYRWDEDVLCFIFKPGYGAFPSHGKADKKPINKPNIYVHGDVNYTFTLPYLTSGESRKKNVNNIYLYGIPRHKTKYMIELLNKERRLLGLPTYKTERERK